MEILEDVTVDEPLIAGSRRRFESFIPNYLEAHLRKSDVIVSIGCGIGHDVRLLCDLGYDAYGLDPGVRWGIWKLLPDAADIRRRFFESCLDTLKPGGRLLVSTSNRLCPIDVGHAHHYTWLGNLISEKARINLTVPLEQAEGKPDPGPR